ncbi:hypothetical protein BD310DRAFT_910390 [Dichomitus squalens]|uniref:Uncharacterized protein n=1 Tax=Dichomitus squalens TaxID=114155 RepID=A0A4Q9PGY1_9APHY|nr:hypothetical protein BD310DRAFT_910390 [Dichomitus squalens]
MASEEETTTTKNVIKRKKVVEDSSESEEIEELLVMKKARKVGGARKSDAKGRVSREGKTQGKMSEKKTGAAQKKSMGGRGKTAGTSNEVIEIDEEGDERDNGPEGDKESRLLT